MNEGSSKVSRFEMQVRFVALAAYGVLIVPILVFFCGWLHWYIALVACGLLVGGFVWLYRVDYVKIDQTLRLPRIHTIAIAMLFGLWVALAGICGVGVEAIDVPYRMAILSDLIAYDWPVVYEQTGYAMVYYYAFWIIPALVGKVFGVKAALFCIWLLETTILVLSFLLICAVLKASRPSRLWMIAIVLMGFSGLNIVGALFGIFAGTNPVGRLTFSTNLGWLDGLDTAYATHFMYRTNTDTLCEVFNQTPLWLVVPLMLQNRRIHSFFFLGLLVLPYSPWGLVGVCPLMICLGVMRALHGMEGKPLGIKRTLCALFSPANICGALSVGVIYVLFYTSASVMSSASSATKGYTAEIAYSTGNVGIIPLWELGPFVIVCYVVFCLLTFGVFAIMLFNTHKHNPLFWTCVVWLAIIPLVWVSAPQVRDFCMNVSLAPLTLLMIWVMGYLDEHLMGKRINVQRALAWGVIVVSFGGGLFGILQNPVILARHGTLHVVSTFDAVDTFAEGDIASDSNVANFLALDPSSSVFFKYLAR